MLREHAGARWGALYAIPLALACGSSGKSTPQISAGSGGLDDSGGTGGAPGNGDSAGRVGMGGSAGTSGEAGAAGATSDGGTSGRGGVSAGDEGGVAGSAGAPPLPPELTLTAEPSAAIVINGIWGSAADDVYAVGDGGDFVHSTGDGTWKQQTIDTHSSLTGVWGSSRGDIYVSVNSNFLLHSAGDGKWLHQTAAAGEVFRDIWGASATQIYALVGGGVDLSSGDANWSKHVTINDTAYTRAIWGASAQDVFVATDYNSNAPTVYRLSESGDWTGDQGSPQVSLADITGSDPNHLYAIGADTVFSSRGDGNWKPDLVVTGAIIQAVWAASSDAVYACTSQGTLYRSNGAGTWSDPQIIDPAKGSALGCRCIWGSDVNNIYIGTPGAGIYHATK